MKGKQGLFFLTPSGPWIRRGAIPRWAAQALWLSLALMPLGAAQAAPSGIPPDSARTEADTGLVPGEGQVWGTVRVVPDGTSLVVVTPELAILDVRLLGVEPPEVSRQKPGGVPATPGQPFGEEAARYARDLLMDKQVRLEPFGKDRSGRILAVVWLGEINVNLTLVKEGFAWVSPSVTVPRVRAELEVAERQAQVGKYGLWALPNPEPPWEFRRRHNLPVE